ncbi:MAG: pyridoxamine 5'-phosphate oxidase family protein [Bacteroidetes bacterium]|nr:pyridoxamine 5'-phosphate oxidase family protein [Bacteroidota bacterium]
MEKEIKLDKEALDKLQKIVNEVKVAMMCTLMDEEKITSRPMSTAKIDDQGAIWFFTNDSSSKARQIEDQYELVLCYSKPSANTYATVHGRAKIMEDQEKIDELWNPLLKAWFPKGKEDPDLALIRVDPHHAEYWDDNSSRMITFLKIAAASVTGEPYGSGKYGELNL